MRPLHSRSRAASQPAPADSRSPSPVAMALLVAATLAGLAMLLLAPAAHAGKRAAAPAKAVPKAAPADTIGRVVRSEAEWRKVLTPEQFFVLRQQGTERAFTGKYWDNHAPGIYQCAACGLTLFRSAEKFDSGTGWPSFWAPADPTHLVHSGDRSVDLAGDELQCARCGGHLGHVFDDGPRPTGLRYCIDSVSLKFIPGK